MKLRTNVLVDGNNLLHRASAIFVEGTPDPLRSSSGYPTGLIYGFLSMLAEWVPSISSPSRMDVFFDGVPRRRIAADPTYKQKEEGALRFSGSSIVLSDGYEATDDFDVLRHVLGLLGADVYRHPDEEADDLIASYIASRPDDLHVVISSDRDFYQLLGTGRVVLYRPGVPGNRFFDAERAAEDLEKRYGAPLSPSNIRMFKALTGDPSDGIVGVPRLRKKVAASVSSHPSVDSLFDSGLPGFSPAEKEKTLGLRDRISLNWDLIGLRGDIDLASSRTPGAYDHAAASLVLKKDLDIHSVHPHVFEFGPSRVRTSPEIPDWLQGI